MNATATRPQVSVEFLRENKCRRVLDSAAKVIAEKGYGAAKVSDIVRGAGVARKTFYDCYGGKEEAALGLVNALGVVIEEDATSLDIFAIEVAAMHRAGMGESAAECLRAGQEVLRSLIEVELNSPPPSGELRRALPSGWHGLSSDFVRKSQRVRLLESAAAMIAERGWPAVSIKDVCSRASVSRRTFYEHAGTLDALAGMLLAETVRTNLLDEFDQRSGLYAVAIETIAERLVDDDSRTSLLADRALRCIAALSAALSEDVRGIEGVR